MSSKGYVYILGAGPGDEDLITVKGLDAIKKADVIIYDNLANRSLLRQAKPDAEVIYVGKQANQHTLKQEEINKLLVKKALENKLIVRLKGGDPFVFGRGSEEALELVENNILFEVIPGITSGIAAPAYAGIPFTHRGFTATAAFVTGHEDPTKEDSDINWSKLATAVGTIVFYMGVKNLPHITEQLMKHGRSPQTPVALVRSGTYNSQETFVGTLETITQVAADNKVTPPVITIVGEVVSLRDKLRWFDNRPLFGKRIIVTRSRSQASELTKQLQVLGADVIEMPSIDISPVDDFAVIDSEIKDIQKYSWLIFTSVNGVDIFFSRLFALGFDVRKLHHLKIAVIGSETGIRLRTHGLVPDLQPFRFTSEGTVEAFKQLKKDYTGETILLPSSEIARDLIPAELRAMGAEVTTIAVYKNNLPDISDAEIQRIFSKPVDLVTFTSSSTVSNYVTLMKRAGQEGLITTIQGASIGPVTSSTANDNHIPLALEAEVSTIEGLVNAIQDYYQV